MPQLFCKTTGRFTPTSFHEEREVSPIEMKFCDDDHQAHAKRIKICYFTLFKGHGGGGGGVNN